MSDEAEDQGHNLADDGQVSCQQEEHKVVNCVAFVVFIDPVVKVRRNNLDAVEEGPEGQWQRQHDCGSDQQTSEVFVKQVEVLLDHVDQQTANDDEQWRKKQAKDLGEDF